MIELNRIYNEECLEGMKRIENESIDMILCDLPYGTTACKWDVILPFEKLWEQYKRVIKKNGAIVLTASQPFTSMLVSSNLEMFRYCLVWNKIRSAGFLNANKMPMKSHEDILVFYKKLPIYNPQRTIGKPYDKTKYNHKIRYENDVIGHHTKINEKNYGERLPTSILTFSQNWKRQDQLHPTQKPVALFEYLIKTYTNEGDLVLDNCLGSGTTAVAAMNTNRKFIGFELDKDYHKISIDRIEKNKQRLATVNNLLI